MAGIDLLTDGRIRAARPRPLPYKLRDGAGLYLLITPGGAKQWRLRYAAGGRESMLSLGTYPATSLTAARARRAELRSALEAGRNPSLERRAARTHSANTFEAIAGEWLDKQPFAPKTREKANWMFEDVLFPLHWFAADHGTHAARAPGSLRRLERRGKIETAHRIKQRVGQVTRYAIATGRALRDPTADLRGALAPHSRPLQCAKRPYRISCLPTCA